MKIDLPLLNLESSLSSRVDPQIFYCVLALLVIGVTMMTSTTVEMAYRDYGDPFFLMKKQGVFLLLGMFCIFLLSNIRLVFWERVGPLLLIVALAALVLVLVPGIGRSVNGSSRWLALGPISLQVSEFAKIATIIYLAGYITRHEPSVQTSFRGFLNPVAVLAVIVALLVMEPDFGSAVVFVATVFIMLYLGGVKFSQFLLFTVSAIVILSFIAVSDDYRLDRISSFRNPWADPFNTGFQLTQALIAIGNGGLFGVGIGESVQKLFYLPEAHNDFVFSVLAEETGLFGVLILLTCYFLLVKRCFILGAQAQAAKMTFAQNLAYGCGVWLALQSTISLSVNMGLLPTKGLSLPFLSVGGSNLLASCIAIGLLMRVYLEVKERGVRRVSKTKVRSPRRGR